MPIDFATAEPDSSAAAKAQTLPLTGGAPLEGNGRGVGTVRWGVLALVFAATAINYLDRGVMGLLAPQLCDRFSISLKAYGKIQAIFALIYALGQLESGPFLEAVGLRVGYAVSLTAWSLASMAHALARSTISFGVVRGFLGISESPNFPAAVKTVTDWFPRRERAFAMGVVNAGSNCGTVLTPLLVPWLALTFGWQSAFIVTGVIGLLWVVVWIPVYRSPAQHPRLSASERGWINSDPPETSGHVRWITLLSYRQTWAFIVGKFMSDPIWWFYMTWLAEFFHQRHGVDLKHIGPPMLVVSAMAVVGSMAGGWLSSTMLRMGWSLNAARKTAMLICALGVTPIVFAAAVPMWPAVLLLGLAVASHQGWSSNLYTLCSDMFPRRAVSSVAGIGGTFGYFGSMAFSVFTGYLLTWTHKNYTILFLIAGSAYLVAFVILQLLAPTLAPVTVTDEASAGS